MNTLTPTASTAPVVLTTPELAILIDLSQPTLRKAARNGGLRLGGDLVPAIMTDTRVIWPATPVFNILGLTAERAAEVMISVREEVTAANTRRLAKYRGGSRN